MAFSLLSGNFHAAGETVVLNREFKRGREKQEKEVSPIFKYSSNYSYITTASGELLF
jgi:hypothetical protein